MPSPSIPLPRVWSLPLRIARFYTRPLSPPSRATSRTWRKELGTTLTPLTGAQRTTRQMFTIPDSQSWSATASVAKSSGSRGSTPRPSHATPPRMAPALPLTSSKSTPNPSLQPIPWNLYWPGSTIPSLVPQPPSTLSAKLHMSSKIGKSRPTSTVTETLMTPSASHWLRPRNTRPTLIGIGLLKGYAKPGWKQCVLLPVSLT